ncbi:hypothetical protein QBC40DRAFT_250737 [Triangularia verruculosa]|uniref:Uncharacterized protein n=1 Tax=Triangularia verruculosa TaxID=2587418 RepID=A0AAN6XP04_9PEZI|nr:hypothetical protein QBC40DRAFT_250737 [Triangularia verruculosa]
MTNRIRRLRAWLGISSRSKENFQSSDIEVTVIPLLDDGETTAGVLFKALRMLSWVMAKMNGGSVKSNNLESERRAIANAITDIVNAMARVPDQAKPGRICCYHVYATSTAIANFPNARCALADNYYGEAMHTILIQVMKAYTYFGMAVLVNLGPTARNLAAAIATVVADSVDYTAVLSPETTRNIARDLISDSNGANLPPSPPPYHAPLTSILTSDQLAGLARTIAMSTGYDRRMSAIAFATAVRKLDGHLFRSCLTGYRRSMDIPVCFCMTAPLPEAKCKVYLLPGV